MREYIITVHRKPIPASRPRVTRWSSYYKEPYNSYKDILKDIMMNESGSLLKPVFDASMALKIDIIFELEIPKSLSKKKQELLVGRLHTKKPDIDNLVKSVLDAMNDIWFKDDGQIACLSVVKKYSREPKTIIVIKEINEC